MTEGKRRRTIRQLGGEIWIEIEAAVPVPETDWRTRDRIIEVVMAVLARHAGTLIENDEDLPVAPLPSRDPRPR